MTELTKPIRRKVTLFLDGRREPRPKDRITVSLYPDQTIGFRPLNTRTEFRIPLAACYKLAILEHGKEEKQKSLVKRQISRGLLTTEGRR